MSKLLPLSTLVRLSFALACLMMLSGCSVQYLRGKRTEVSRFNDENSQLDSIARLDTNEIVMLDKSGVVCSGAQTGLNQASARQGAINKMVREGSYRETYTWRVHSPAEYQGIDCGIYYHWGSGENVDYDRRYHPTPRGSEEREVTTWNAGYQMYGWGEWIPGLAAGYARFRVNLGRTTVGTGDDDERRGIKLGIPLHVGLRVAPTWLYGFGVEAYGGGEAIAAALSKRGRWYEKFDYGGSILYQAGIGANFNFRAEVSRKYESQISNDPSWWTVAEETQAGIMIEYPYEF